MLPTAADPNKWSLLARHLAAKTAKTSSLAKDAAPSDCTPPNAARPSVPTILGVVASQRFAEQLSGRKRAQPPDPDDRRDTRPTNPGQGTAPRTLFAKGRVVEAIQEVVGDRMSGFRYTAGSASTMVKRLAEEIKDRVKELNFDRYKIVCLVSIGQRTGQGLRITSRCTWDVTHDNHCTYTWTNDLVFCTATVYGLYHE